MKRHQLFIAILGIFFCCLSTINTSAQTKLPPKLIQYYKQLDAAELAFHQKKYSEALGLAKNAELSWKINYSLAELYIICYLKLGNKQKAKEWVRYNLVHYHANLRHYTAQDFHRIPYFGLYENSPIIIELKKEEKALRDSFLMGENREIMSKYEQAKFCFTQVNKHFLLSEITDSANLNQIRKKFKGADSMTIQNQCLLPTIDWILKKTVYPDETNIGSEPWFFGLMLIQCPVPNKLAIINSGLSQGKLDPYWYAYIYDRCIQTNYYGTKLTKDKNNQIVLDDIPNVYTVDDRRAEIGLDPLYLVKERGEFNLSEEYRASHPK